MSKLFPCIALACLLAWAGCDSQREQNDFAEQAFAPPADFTHTDTNGEVLEQDPDDWRVGPRYQGAVTIQPAYPNPAQTDLVQLTVTIRFATGIHGLRLSEWTESTGRLFHIHTIPEAGEPGVPYVFSINPAEISSEGLHRVIVTDGLTGEIVTYGDIMVE